MLSFLRLLVLLLLSLRACNGACKVKKNEKSGAWEEVTKHCPAHTPYCDMDAAEWAGAGGEITVRCICKDTSCMEHKDMKGKDYRHLGAKCDEGQCLWDCTDGFVAVAGSHGFFEGCFCPHGKIEVEAGSCKPCNPANCMYHELAGEHVKEMKCVDGTYCKIDKCIDRYYPEDDDTKCVPMVVTDLAHVEYKNDILVGFNAFHDYDNLLSDYEYDVAVEEARENRAIARLKGEKKDVLRAKMRMIKRNKMKQKRHY